MPITTLTHKGQVTIPKEIRDLLQLKPGDRLEFVQGVDGQVYLVPCNIDVRKLSGILYQEGQQSVSLEEMEAAIVAEASESAEVSP